LPAALPISFFRSCDWRTVNANRIEPLKANRRDIPDPGNPERMTGRAEQLSPRSESHSAGHARPGLHRANHSAHFDLAGRVIDRPNAVAWTNRLDRPAVDQGAGGEALVYDHDREVIGIKTSHAAYPPAVAFLAAKLCARPLFL